MLVPVVRVPPERNQQATWTPGQINTRALEQVHVNPSPDPAALGGAHGEIAARPSVRQIALSFYDTTRSVWEDRFVAIIVGPQPEAAYPRGSQIPFYPRQNLSAPASAAYGSLFDAPRGSMGY
jgi:hypothetical protein